MSLYDIGLQYGTDKGRHGYLPLYEKEVDWTKVRRFLEVGAFRGCSLRMWVDWMPDIQIYGVDLRDRMNTAMKHPRITLVFHDQGKRESLQDFVTNHGSSWDIIIDDGGHFMQQQMATLGFMFKHISPGGVFVVEDLITSSDPYYNPTSTKRTSLVVLQDFVQSGKIESEFILPEEAMFLEKEIAECKIIKARKSEIAFLWRRPS